MASTALKTVVKWGPLAFVVYEKFKEIPIFKRELSKIGLAEPPMEMPGPSTTNNTSNNSVINSNNSVINLVPDFTNDPQKIEAAFSVFNVLNGMAPSTIAFAAVLSCAINIVQGERAIAEFRRMNEHLGRISDSAWSEFSFGDKFPQHVYELLQTEMNASIQKRSLEDKEKITECFFIFNPGTQWWPKFERMCESEPLPDGFFGCFTNLDALITLIQHVLRPALGQAMLFTIIMPTQINLLWKDPVMLPRGIGPLQFKGELQANGEPCLYMNLCRLETNTVLICVGNSPKSESNWGREVAGPAVFMGLGVPYMAACGMLGAIPVVGVPLAIVAWMGGGPPILFGAVQAVEGSDCWKVKVRVLGSEDSDLYDPNQL